MIKLKGIPKFGDVSHDVLELQLALQEKGFFTGHNDGDFGKKTLAKVVEFQKANGLTGTGVIGEKTLKLLGLGLEGEETAPPKKEEPKKSGIPWFWKAKEYSGKSEFDPAFDKEMSKHWKLVGLPGFKTIVGSARAWCSLFIVATLFGAGYSYQADRGAAAKSQDNYGVAINWKVHGIPQGAIVRINAKADCKSAAGNHVAYADGDCAPSSLGKGATINLYGGNQGQKAKVSVYAVSKICAVRWPSDAAFPPPVKVSKNCTSGKAGNESTR